MGDPLRRLLPLIFLAAAASAARAQVADPQLGTDHPYFAGEKAMSTPSRVLAFSNAVPRGTLGASNDREKLIRLFLWRAEHFGHQLSPAVYNLPGVVPDPPSDNSLMIDYDAMRALFSYGFGLCGTNHGQMRAFIEPFGWTDRRRGLNGDTGYEVFVDGGWRYVNTDQYTLHFLSNSPAAHFASLDEVMTTNHRYIEWNPDLGMGYRLPQANTHGSYQDFAGVTGTVANRSLQWRDYYQNVWNKLPADSIKMYGEGYAAAPMAYRLRRGETFTRWVAPDGAVSDLGLAGRAWWGFKGSGGPYTEWSFVQNGPARDEVPGGAEESRGQQRYGNGCFDWQPSLAASEHLDGAAAVTGTLVAGGAPALRSTGASTLVLEHYTPYTIAARPADGIDPAGNASDGAVISATAAGSIPVEVSVNAGATWTSAGTLSGTGSVDFTNLVKGRNQYLVRLSFDDAEGLSTLRLRTLTMLNQALYPNLKDGTAQVSYEAQNQGAIDLSPDLWTSGSAGSMTGYVTKEADSGNVNAVHYAGGSTYAYQSTNNQPLSLTWKVVVPPALAAAGATWKGLSAAAMAAVRVPPSLPVYTKIEVASAATGPWTEIANYGPPADNELSAFWAYGKTSGTLGGTTHYVRFTTYNGGFTAGIRFLRIYGTYSMPASGSPVTVTYHWNNGTDQSASHTVPAGASAESWSVSTGSNVVQRKVVIASGSGAAAVAPAITTQPSGQTVTEGQTATFSVVASGTAPLQYQWRRNGANVAGATSSSYTTPATTAADNGAVYSVVVTNGSGSATSPGATLTVNPPAGGGTPVTATFRQGQAGYSGVTDTYVDEFLPSSSFGTTDRLELRWYDAGTGLVEHNRVLMRFDLSSVPAGATVTAAKLVLYNIRANSNGPSDVVSIERVTSAWTDATTWTSRPSTAATGLSGPNVAGYTGNPAVPELYEFTGIESLVQGWVTTPASNLGLMMLTGTNLNLRFPSSEYATVQYRPALELTYTAGGGGGTPGAPVIASQPASTTAAEGTTAAFGVTASGTGPFTYQWLRNGTPVGGATGSTYTTPALAAADDGAVYSVVVTNGGGSTTSSGAVLTVTPAGGGGGTPPAAAPPAEGNDADQRCSCGAAGPGLPPVWVLAAFLLPAILRRRR